MITWVLFLGIGLIVGVIAGLYLARLDDFSNKQKNALQQQLDAAELQMKAYQSQVAEHFLKTAALVNTMTESYKAVHEHLASGARHLCGSQVTVDQLEMPAVRLLNEVEAEPLKRPMPEPKHPVLEREELNEALQKDAAAMETLELNGGGGLEAVQPPATPESLHEEESDSKAEEAEKARLANISRMVH